MPETTEGDKKIPAEAL